MENAIVPATGAGRVFGILLDGVQQFPRDAVLRFRILWHHEHMAAPLTPNLTHKLSECLAAAEVDDPTRFPIMTVAA
jgi:hypothetical protein